MQFSVWLINEIKTPSIDPNFFKNALQKFQDLEKILRPTSLIFKKIFKLEWEFLRKDNLEHFWYSLPIDRDFLKRPYSKEIQSVLDYSKMQGVTFWDTNRQIKHFLEYHGINGDLSQFRQNFIELTKDRNAYLNKLEETLIEYKDDLDSDDNLPDFSEALGLVKKVKELVHALGDYVFGIEQFQKQLQVNLSARDSETARYFGDNKRPETKNVEVLYHATPYIREIKATGLKVGDNKALGGDTSKGVSFTADYNIAKAIVRSLREVIAIAKGQISAEQVLVLAKSRDVDLAKTDPYFRFARGDRDKSVAFDLFRYYLGMDKNRYDPLFFGATVGQFEKLDPRNVGIIAAKVDMSKIIEYLPSMEEYRIPPDAVIDYKVI